MDKFWEWMKENHRCKDYRSGENICKIYRQSGDKNICGCHIVPNKHMLIGYMIEYLMKHDEMFDTICLSNDINLLYKGLESRIEGI